MCGICGKINYKTTDIVHSSLIEKMCCELQHRGPDNRGIYTKGSIGLGHQRLSIIDLSKAGNQPMSNHDKTIWMVFNGEIYNFLELKKNLQNKGYKFQSQTDSEVLLYLYQDEGVNCLKKLRGMFSFAIWDKRENLLFLARDRVGQKPLFYALTSDSLIFASELKAILQDKKLKQEIDPVSIHYYLTYQYIPSPRSIFKNIYKLPPAHYLLLKNNKIEVQKYWQLDFLPKWNIKKEKKIEQLLLEELKEAVNIRLISDVPLGCFLSGGLDSSIIVALMSKMSQGPVKTFSIGFCEEKYNELPYAKIVAQKFNTDHTELKVKPDALSILPKLAWNYNEPYADSSAIPTYYVSQLASQHVKVILNGDGGDENFAGYDRYFADELCRKFQRVFPPKIGKIASNFISLFPIGNSKSLPWKIKRFLEGYSSKGQLRYAKWMSHFTPELKNQLYSNDFKSIVNKYNCFDILFNEYEKTVADNNIEKLLSTDIALYLPNDLLVKVDIASMSNSIEARSPFLDHKLMEFVARLPHHYKLRKNISKYILKKLAKDILPPEIITRKKMGFGVPLDIWFRGELKDLSYDILLSSDALGRQYFNQKFVKKMLDEHNLNRWNWQYQLYNLLMLELWYRKR